MSSNSIIEASRTAKIAKKKVRIHSDKYLIRSLKVDDASDRWAAWMSDPEVIRMLNVSREWKKSDVLNYINEFDQRSNLLLGIFEKPTWKHIGVLTINIDQAANQFLVNMIIGEPEYRNKGVTNDITVPFRDYFFETLGFDRMACMALSHNHIIIHYLLNTGWKLDKTLKQHVKSNVDGTMLDVCFFSVSRDAWRAWKKAHPEGVR